MKYILGLFLGISISILIATRITFATYSYDYGKQIITHFYIGTERIFFIDSKNKECYVLCKLQSNIHKGWF